MKRFIAATTFLFASNMVMASGIQWQKPPLNFEQLRSSGVTETNNAIMDAGGLSRLMKDATSTKNADAKYVVSRLFLYGIVEKQDLNKALDFLTESANLGNNKAILEIAKINLNIHPLIKLKKADKEKALHLLKKSANLNNVEAQYWLGLCYFNGDGEPKDIDLGLFWLTKASDSGYYPAENARKQILNETNKYSDSFDYVRQRASEGNEKYLVKLAKFYEDGYVVQKDDSKSIRLLKTAAELGSKDAASLLKNKGY